MRGALDRQRTWLAVADTRRYTRRDWVFLAGVAVASVAMMFPQVHGSRSVTTAVLLALLALAYIVYRPWKPWQWACAALYVVVLCIYWAGLVSLLALGLIFFALVLLLPVAAAARARYRRT
jgi:hypothetical protein